MLYHTFFNPSVKSHDAGDYTPHGTSAGSPFPGGARLRLRCDTPVAKPWGYRSRGLGCSTPQIKEKPRTALTMRGFINPGGASRPGGPARDSRPAGRFRQVPCAQRGGGGIVYLRAGERAEFVDRCPGCSFMQMEKPRTISDAGLY